MAMDWTVLVFKDAAGKIDVTAKQSGFTIDSSVLWHRGAYPQIAAENLVKTLKEFSQEKLLEFATAMNKPAEEIKFGGKADAGK